MVVSQTSYFRLAVLFEESLNLLFLRMGHDKSGRKGRNTKLHLFNILDRQDRIKATSEFIQHTQEKHTLKYISQQNARKMLLAHLYISNSSLLPLFNPRQINLSTTSLTNVFRSIAAVRFESSNHLLQIQIELHSRIILHRLPSKALTCKLFLSKSEPL